jgi:hypothetical protein
MTQTNTVRAVYVGIRSGVTYRIPLDVQPILISSDEITPGNASATRLEYQDFGIEVIHLKNLYPPLEGDKVERLDTHERFTAASMGMDEPPFQHTTSNRERILVHTHRDSRGY